jgi:hypothetical protein
MREICPTVRQNSQMYLPFNALDCNPEKKGVDDCKNLQQSRLTGSCVDQFPYRTAGFPRFDLTFSPTSLWQCCVMFGVGYDPWPATPCIRAVAPQVFCESLVQINNGANIKFARGLALENVRGWHCRGDSNCGPSRHAGTLYFYLNPNVVGTRRLELLTFPARRDALLLLESKCGRHEETRTPDLYRVKVAL